MKNFNTDKKRSNEERKKREKINISIAVNDKTHSADEIDHCCFALRTQTEKMNDEPTNEETVVFNLANVEMIFERFAVRCWWLPTFRFGQMFNCCETKARFELMIVTECSVR
jgi:hypothetical protein